ncbi:hypothetical protein Taro_017484 [Colocasia esculenta]|uniref:PARP-type domain-containing protein n=1 Tax=Colocasia esculenta TaxID=4460 RepID=A0A843UW61_COLES|nr:hypothetical protein [Colocasia esculenta]
MPAVFRYPNLSTFSSANPGLSKLLLVGVGPRSASPVPLRSVSAQFRLIVAYSTPPMASPKVSAEYAKSSRSSCKACGKNIPAGSLRLGLCSKDPRGFDMTKWHHLDCFPVKERAFAAVEEIMGYSLLKKSEQEALKNLELVSAAKSSIDEKIVAGGVATEEDVERMPKKPRDASLPPKWKAFKTVIFREADDGLRDSDKIAAFDFDGCLVNTSVKRIGPDAWSLLYPSIPEKLQNLYSDDYKLVIFTNESNIERWKNKRQVAVDSKIGRIENFLKHVKVPMQVFIACGLGKGKDQSGDPFRKPNPGMWRILEKYFNSGIAIDMDRSFFVGDAAGRKNDHSDADAKFAEAVGLKFHLPEDVFGA